MKDFYYILGVDTNCTVDEIKEAYRKLSKKFHPDLNQGDEYFQNRFREINEAYETLIDPESRSRYDKNLHGYNPIDAEFKRRQYYRQQAANGYYHGRPPAYRRLRRGPGAGVAIVLIVLVLVLGVYLAESFFRAKKHPVKVSDSVSVTTTLLKPRSHHKKKHNLLQAESHKAAAAAKNVKPSIPLLVAEKQPVIETKQVKAEDIKKPAAVAAKPIITNPVKPVILANDKIIASDNAFPYAAYMQPNVTGVVYMRKFDDYGSEVIEKIPANAKVVVLDKGNTYYKVSFNNYIGYVPKWSLRLR